MLRPRPTTGTIYHIYNRGVEKRKVFSEEKDYVRFIHDLFEFNDQEPANNTGYWFKQQLLPTKQYMEVGLPYIIKNSNSAGTSAKKRKLMVEMMVFCLMPNHFHLIVKQKREDGISEFMRKVGTGYTNYFNQKKERVGPLFQGKYKIIPLTDNAHLLHLPYYIHTNPLDLIQKNSEPTSWKQQIKFLENYRWSSFSDYIDKKNFPSVTQREFLTELLGNPQEYKKSTTNWLKERDENLEVIKGVTLE